MMIAKKFSLRPNKLVLYNEISRGFTLEEIETQQRISEKLVIEKKELVKTKNKIEKKFHNFKISKNAYRNMQEKINWLYYLSKSRNKQTYTGKNIYNFKLAFITLTLPSVQRHPTSEITKKVFNQFLTELRQSSKMQNYVWRLEFQKNRNVHYHLVTDSYLDYFLIRKIWNRNLKKLGYIEEYKNKFKDLSLYDYNKITNKNNKVDFSVIKKRYSKGKKENWKNPNTVDVKSVYNNKTIANYISKYFGKDSNEQNECNSLDNESNSFGLRLWFCSRKLSKLISVRDYIENANYNVEYILKFCSTMKYKVHKYCVVVYYKLNKKVNEFSRFLDSLFRSYAKSVGYECSS